MALSRGSPRVGVTDHPALWSPDLPRQGREALTRPPGRLVHREGKPSGSRIIPRTDRGSCEDSLSSPAGPQRRTTPAQVGGEPLTETAQILSEVTQSGERACVP
ncbi:hypothetical protein Mro03_27580 [Microbispora rosea subsp. rosea]|nr:hypothetical protein Mro03_27580 [Microbispora rosea subsp. rosea]